VKPKLSKRDKSEAQKSARELLNGWATQGYDLSETIMTSQGYASLEAYPDDMTFQVIMYGCVVHEGTVQ
jgi:hypothetical protein